MIAKCGLIRGSFDKIWCTEFSDLWISRWDNRGRRKCEQYFGRFGWRAGAEVVLRRGNNWPIDNNQDRIVSDGGWNGRWRKFWGGFHNVPNGVTPSRQWAAAWGLWTRILPVGPIFREYFLILCIIYFVSLSHWRHASWFCYVTYLFATYILMWF